ncbi:MAG TPA: GNAT family N-acetyltransferase [Planctomycetaceae bacterium]|jgi:GNAT superfamily N-acetyltransferase|nr:GNAT family N-acetyltransferase [Planctomycetaceae bacterium]
MTDELDLHVASADERTQAFRNVHDVWSGGLELEEHVRRRSANPKFDNATWYVGTLAGRVVAACGCFHVSVCIDGTVERACAVGSVHTLAEFRGRGFAPRVLAFAETQERLVGKTFSLLYSDISPGYYARLGYRLCPAASGWIHPMQSQSTPSAGCDLVRFQPAEELTALLELYNGGHVRYSLSIARSMEYWQYLVVQNPQDEFYFAEVAGRRLGYVRLGMRPPAIVIRDLSLVQDDDEAERAFYSAVIALAQARGAERVGGWMPADTVCRKLFQVADRAQELTMIKPLVERVKIDERHCEAARHFHEIDHV